MRSKSNILMLISAAFLVGITVTLAANAGEKAACLVAKPPIVIPGGSGKFDWMTVDLKRRRLLAAHTGKGTLEVLDLDSNKLISSVKAGACQGVAVDDKKYFAGDTREQKLVILDAVSLKQLAEIPVPGEIDAIAYDSKNHKVYADHDDGGDIWVLPSAAGKLTGTIQIPGMPEFVEYDEGSDRLYQNIKSNNTVQVINPNNNKIEASWPTAPAEKPHGLAIDARTRRLFSAGGNGQLVVIDMKTGKVLKAVSIENRVDQIAFDPGKRRVYCACSGAVSVVEETADGARLLENVPVHKGAHTLTVDPKTHAVWISYADGRDSYLQRLDCQ